jgi:hypothetical protein
MVSRTYCNRRTGDGPAKPLSGTPCTGLRVQPEPPAGRLTQLEQIGDASDDAPVWLVAPPVNQRAVRPRPRLRLLEKGDPVTGPNQEIQICVHSRIVQDAAFFNAVQR